MLSPGTMSSRSSSPLDVPVRLTLIAFALLVASSVGSADGKTIDERAEGTFAVAPFSIDVTIRKLFGLSLAAQTQRSFGALGLYGGTALAALADAHSPVAALGALQAAGTLSAEAVRDGALLAVATNSVSRSVTAFAAGGAAYGSRVALSLLLSTGAAAAVAWALGSGTG